MYKKAIKLAPNTPTAVFDFGDLMGSKDGLKNEVFDALISVIKTKELRQMLIAPSESPAIYQPSKFWINYMIYNIYQIEACGIENFKRSVNNNYHTWLYAALIIHCIILLRKNLDGATTILMKLKK